MPLSLTVTLKKIFSARFAWAALCRVASSFFRASITAAVSPFLAAAFSKRSMSLASLASRFVRASWLS